MVREKDKPNPGSMDPLIETASTMSTHATSLSSRSQKEQGSRMPLGICPSVMEKSLVAKKEDEQTKGKKVPKRTKKTKKKGADGEKTVVGRQLKNGTTVEAASYKWEVTGLLGAGGFGAVYKVTNQGRVVPKEGGENPQFPCAMKVEKNSERDSRLKGEAAVYIMVNNLEAERKKHFATIYDRGETKTYKFIVIQMLGLSLYDVRKRDIKPQNFVVGVENEKSLIFLIDFGIARNMFKKDDHTHLKSQRETSHFLGTVKFAPLAAHKCVDQSFKDDLEAFIYMVFDCLDSRNGLPWGHLTTLGPVRELKEKFMACDLPNWFKEYEKSEFYSNMIAVIKYVGRLSYSSIPNYEKVMNEIQAMADSSKINLSTDNPEWASVSGEKAVEPRKARTKKSKRKKNGKKSKEEVRTKTSKEKMEQSKMGREEATRKEQEEKTRKNGKEGTEAVKCGAT